MENGIIDKAVNIENVTKTKTSKPYSRKLKDEFKEKECKVINYNKLAKTLDIKFDGYGIRINNIDSFSETNMVIVKYKSKIGSPDFMIKI